LSKPAIPSLPIVVVGIGVRSIKHSMQGMISKQELFNGKHLRCLRIDSTSGEWLAHQRHFLLLTIYIDRKEQFVSITPMSDTDVSLF